MTRRTRYPLDALMRLRKEIRNGREQELAVAVARVGEAEAAAEEAHRHAAAGRAAAGRAAEALSDPAASGAHPVRTGATIQEQERYHRRLRAAAAALERSERSAEEEVARRKAALEAAQGALARAEADLELVQRDREAWDLSRRKEAIRKAEEELEDLVASRFGHKPSRSK